MDCLQRPVARLNYAKSSTLGEIPFVCLMLRENGRTFGDNSMNLQKNSAKEFQINSNYADTKDMLVRDDVVDK